jgi:hypothetical protein
MKRHRRAPGGGSRRSGRPGSRHLLLGCAVLLTGTCVSVASAEEGAGRPPLGVTRTAPPSPRTARVGVLLDEDGRHFCTASVVHSPGRDLIVTAAHCVDGGGPLRFAPGYRDGTAPHGVWKVREVFYDEEWAERADEDYDLAFASLEVGEGGRAVEDAVGANPLGGGFPRGPVTVVGHPAARETPLACTARPAALGTAQQRVECPDFTGGTSGGPWLDRAGKVVGVIGGHEEGGATADVSYSVVVGAAGRALYKDALAGDG